MIRTLAIRLMPKQDFKIELMKLVEREQIQAGAILTVVGSLERAHLRFAGESEGTVITEALEIVSCTGTLSQEGMHIHMAVSDPKGHTIGGHVKEGCKVRTTAEIVIVDLTDFTFSREKDEETGYEELQIYPRSSPL